MHGKTKFLGNRGGTILFGGGVLESFITSGGRTATDRTDDSLSVTSDPPTKSTHFHLGTVWPQVTTTNIREDMFQLEIQ
jgi:hypothetical protein